MNEYEKQAQDFAKKYGLTMQTNYLGHYPRLHDTWVTANYRVTLFREGKKPYGFDFSTSVNDSWYHFDDKRKKRPGLPSGIDIDKFFEKYRETGHQQWATQCKNAPTLYDVLAAITKCDPGTFDDFCSNFGYDQDSRGAYNIYLEVQREWKEVERMFGDCLEELEEIN